MCAQRQTKTQISLGIRPVWSVFAVAWRKLGSLAAHWVHSEDSDLTGRIWVFAGRTVTLLIMSCCGSNPNFKCCTLLTSWCKIMEHSSSVLTVSILNPEWSLTFGQLLSPAFNLECFILCCSILFSRLLSVSPLVLWTVIENCFSFSLFSKELSEQVLEFDSWSSIALSLKLSLPFILHPVSLASFMVSHIDISPCKNSVLEGKLSMPHDEFSSFTSSESTQGVVCSQSLSAVWLWNVKLMLLSEGKLSREVTVSWLLAE